MKRFTLPAIIFIILFSGNMPLAVALGELDEVNEFDEFDGLDELIIELLYEQNTAQPAVNTPSVTYEEIKPGHIRQKAKDDIARLEKFSAQIDEMLKQAWEAGRTQTETVITTPYGNITVKFNLDEIIRQTYTGNALTQKLRDWHGEMNGNELRINNGGSWQNETYEGMKITITHELGHYIMDRKNTTYYPVLDIGYRTSVDFSEIEADAFAMRYIGKAAYSETLRRGASSQAYINAVIKRMEEMEREERETLAGLRAVANAPTEAEARQEQARQETARKEAEAARQEAAKQEAARQPEARNTAVQTAADPKTYFNRGLAKYNQPYNSVSAESKSNYEEAITDFTEAIRLDPNYTEAYLYRARVYGTRQFYTADLDKAFADYAEVIRRGDVKLKAAAFRDRGNLYYDRFYRDMQLGHLDKAISDYIESLRLESDNEEVRGKLGERGILPKLNDAIWRRTERMDEKKGEKYDKIIEYYTEVIRAYNKDKIAYTERGWAYFQKRKYKEARADANAALQIDPNFQRAERLDAELKKKRQ